MHGQIDGVIRATNREIWAITGLPTIKSVKSKHTEALSGASLTRIKGWIWRVERQSVKYMPKSMRQISISQIKDRVTSCREYHRHCKVWVKSTKRLDENTIKDARKNKHGFPVMTKIQILRAAKSGFIIQWFPSRRIEFVSAYGHNKIQVQNLANRQTDVFLVRRPCYFARIIPGDELISVADLLRR